MAKKDSEEILSAPSEKDFEKDKESSQEAEGQLDTRTAAVTAETDKPAGTIILYFTEVSEIESIEAERLLQTIPSFRSVGRMPFMNYSAMVESCRLLMKRWPGSRYDYMARRALSKVPENYWSRYGITGEEVDLEYFKKQRPDTKPYTLTEDD